jgi:hypothetical protein
LGVSLEDVQNPTLGERLDKGLGAERREGPARAIPPRTTLRRPHSRQDVPPAAGTMDPSTRTVAPPVTRRESPFAAGDARNTWRVSRRQKQAEWKGHPAPPVVRRHRDGGAESAADPARPEESRGALDLHGADLRHDAHQVAIAFNADPDPAEARGWPSLP